jgi:hypothetical protein
MSAPKLLAEMIAWAKTTEGTAPSEVDDDENNHLLADAIDFEDGTYDRDDSDQRRLAIRAIREFCAATDEYE